MIEKSDLIKLGRECYADPPYFNKVFLSKWFPGRVPWIHLGLMAVLLGRGQFILNYPDADKVFKHFQAQDGEPLFEVIAGKVILRKRRFKLFMLPRGFSKTTLVNSCNIQKTCYQDRSFFLYASETATHAQTQLGNIKRQFEQNDRIKLAFGELQPDQRSGKKWAEDAIETTTGVKVRALGRGGQVRGQNIDAERPQEIILDDVEDKESVKTPEQREKALDWVMSDVMPALPEQDPDAGMTILGTLLHKQAMMMKLKDDPEFATVIFGAHDSDGGLVWPEQMDEEKWEKKRAMYARQGKLAAFYMEYENLLKTDDATIFPRILHEQVPPGGVQTAGALDPAISEKRTADHATVHVVGMDARGRIAVLESWGKIGASPREQIDKLFEFQLKWGCREMGIESVAFQASLVHLAREEMFRRKQFFEIVPITHKVNKMERIKGILQPRYISDFIYHTQEFPKLEQELGDFPNGGDNYPDSLAMAIALLDPFAAMAADPEKDLAENEMPALPEWRGV